MIDKDILTKPTYEMRNPDSKLRGGVSPGYSSVRKKTAEIRLKCLIK